MASNKFLLDKDAINSYITSVRDNIQTYKGHVQSLQSLVQTISSSSAWKDEHVKTSFVNTANSYIKAYNSFSTGLSTYMDCLNKKTNNVIDNESKFS